jgi:hypothetical protein
MPAALYPPGRFLEISFRNKETELKAEQILKYVPC